MCQQPYVKHNFQQYEVDITFFIDVTLANFFITVYTDVKSTHLGIKVCMDLALTNSDITFYMTKFGYKI